MELIDKSAAMAEIEKLYNGEIDTYTRNILDRLKSSIDTLEVKVVDLNLDKELDEFIKTNNAFVKDDFVVEKNNGDSFNHIYDLEGIAKHFFELGFKAQKGE